MRCVYDRVCLVWERFHKPQWGGCFLVVMLLASFGIPLSAQAQTCGTVWEEGEITPDGPGTAYAMAVATNGSRLVAVGWDIRDPAYKLNGIVWTSDDNAENWTTRNANFADYHNLTDICWNGSLYMTVGFGGLVATSSNGITWTERNSPTSQAVRCVIWDGTYWVIGSDDNKVSKSTDGDNWTRSAAFCNYWVMDLAYGESTYVAVGNKTWNDVGPGIYSSTNAINWTLRYQMAAGLVRFDALGYGNGMFVAVGKNNSADLMLMTSNDGTSWTTRSVPAIHGALKDVVYDGSQFLTSAYSVEPEPDVYEDYILTSSNGTSWTPVDITHAVSRHPMAYARMLSEMVNGSLLSVITGDGGGPRIFYSECYPVPFITEHPENDEPCNNGSAQFCVTAVGIPPLSYQWERDVGGGWGNISGAQTTCCTISPVSTADQGDYRCRVWSSGGTVTSNSASLTVRFPPSTFSEQPANQDVCEFESPQFCVTTTGGTPPVSYQWERNTGSGWADAPNGDAQCYTINSVDAAADDDQYRCRVWNDCGTITSDPATLEVHARAKADFDCDDDVDQDDFGHFQGCLSGSGIAQDDPACADAKLDGDTDVDSDDFAKFLNCLSGPGIAPNVDCADGS